MEGERDVPSIKERLLGAAKRLFRKTTPPPAGPPTQEVPNQPTKATQIEYDEAAINQAFRIVAELTQGLSPQKIAGINTRKVGYTAAGQIETVAMSELMTAQETMQIADAEVGDVVWWKDVDNKSGYFLVKKPYSKAGGTGRGALKVEIGDETIQGDGWVNGAGFSMIRVGVVSKNLPVEFVIPTEDEYAPKIYHTNSVNNMGIIKSERIAPPK